MIPGHLKGRHLLRIADWAPDELLTLVDLADELKAQHEAGVPHR